MSGRFLTTLLLATLATACPRKAAVTRTTDATAGPRAEPDSQSTTDELLLVEADLASRVRSGRLAINEFCEKRFPYIAIQGSKLIYECEQNTVVWQIAEERNQAGQRVLASKDGKTLTLRPSGRDRYRVGGTPCQPKPQFYVAFPEARTFRTEWIKRRSCPAHDMKLMR